MDSREAIIALNMVNGVGPIRLRQLLEHFGEADAVLKASRGQLERVKNIEPEVADAIANWEKTVDLAGEIKRIEQFGCKIVIPSDPNYPALLKEIYDLPGVLYVKGELLTKDKNSIAMVGSRMTTHYGMETARKLAYQLAYSGITVVSGGARGIDTASHQGALGAKGRTIAVLGEGINLVYPAENVELFDRIAASGGAVITQFPFNTRGGKHTFPIRNRIVAGMTLGTVVVEANLNSGALITAKLAADYNRQVFAVPGRVDSPRSKGCHHLIKESSAKLCESAEDILTEFEYLFPRSNRPPSLCEGGVPPAIELSEHEQVIYDAIGTEDRAIDEIIRHSGLPASTVSVVLFSLEIKRLIRQLPGKVFVRNK